MTQRNLFKKTDLILIAALVAIALIIGIIFSIIQSNAQLVCTISFDGSIIKTVDLQKDEEFSVDQAPHMVFEVRDDSIAVIESDCPDKVCVHTGYISKAGQRSVCLPNKIVIAIDALKDSENQIDGIVH